ATSDDSLENLLNKATDPAQKEADADRITAFCDKVNAELEGPLLSTRLLAHKIQSPQEKEALYALITLESCVKNCGRYFHQEIGKFRFLNELIKVVSPKYLGNRTPMAVKKRCIEIMYSWHKGLGHEPKIAEAYKMLKAQGIVKQDPVYMDRTFDPFPPPKPRKADFEDDEKAKTLEKLLRSKNPDDLQAANRLIKNMVKEDAEKSERKSRRINELEAVGNQVKLLTEMISQYSSSATSKEELEMMKELYESLEKARPSLFRLASDTDENDTDGINDILHANDAVTRVMTLYKEKVEGEKPAGDYTAGAKDTSLLDDLGFDSSARSNAPASTEISGSGLLENDFRSFGLGDMSELGSVFNNLPTATSQQQQFSGMAGLATPAGMGMVNFGAQSAFRGMPSMQPAATSSMSFPAGMPPAYSAISHNVRPMAPSTAAPALIPSAVGQPAFSTSNGVHPAASQSQPIVSVFSQSSTANGTGGNSSSSLSDLDILDKSLQDYKLSKESFPVKTMYKERNVPAKLPMNQLAANKAAAATSEAPPPLKTGQPLVPASFLTPQPTSSAPSTAAPPAQAQVTSTDPAETDFSFVSAAPEPELLPLTDVFVPLEKIQPAPNIPSVQAYEKNGLKVMVHFAADRPRPDVVTMVVSTMSTNPSSVSSFVFQAAVPKIMKVKLQPPSASEFPAYNPILPPAAITQVMLVANPRKEKVRLKYKLSYSIGGEQFSDVGDIDGIPVQ
ncbi:hypothetical protein EGW08_006650, partial [Elysia chlorotica]